MHITSLPGDFGCGTLGKHAYEFVDFLKSASQTHWQILPTCPADGGGSPYHSVSARAGCHLLVDLQQLIDGGILSESETSPLSDTCRGRIDFKTLSPLKESLLRTAYARCKAELRNELEEFYSRESAWLADFALFMALHEQFDHKPWHMWEDTLRRRDEGALSYWREKLADQIGYHVFVQYLFFTQWDKLRSYANSNGIRIIGDLPIYVAEDSADVWANQQFFDLDEEFRPRKVSGCPPDVFSPDGQLWNNPLYRWDILQQHHYSWWIDRLRAGLRLYDILRLDHFRGFESYWAVDRCAESAKNGEWLPGPGMDLFRAVCWQMGWFDVIAEDLGFITDGVAALIRESGFPGMRVLQFAFDGNPQNPYLPHNYVPHCVAYTGTHDNNTTLGWADEQNPELLAHVRKYLGISKEQNLADAFTRAVWASPANLAIAPIQDFLCLDGTARMNTPSTITGNWSWRVDKALLTHELCGKIRELTHMYGRNP